MMGSEAAAGRTGPQQSGAPAAPKAQFVSRAQRGSSGGGHRNEAAKFAADMMRSQRSMVDAELTSAFDIVFQQSVYIPNFLAQKDDLSLLNALLADLERHEGGMVTWSKHMKHENPDFSPTFLRIIERMQEYFDVDVFASRLNFYRDGSDWKPFHHDSHAYGAKGVKEDFTMGASFGASRELQFLHEPSGKVFGFPQNNGDIFAFTSEVNQKFMHGVPKATSAKVGPRFSIIAWGKRRTLNSRNGGGDAEQPIDEPRPLSAKPVYDAAHAEAQVSEFDGDASKEKVAMGEVAELVKKLNVSAPTASNASNSARRGGRGGSRVQGGWNRGGGAAGRSRSQGSSTATARPQQPNRTLHSDRGTPAPAGGPVLEPQYDDDY